MLTLSHLHQYLSDRGKEIRNYADDGHPWTFLLCACFIDYLVSMTYNKSSKAKDYKNFVRDFLAETNPVYNTFKYQSGAQDLPEQMYHILRCGIVHSFSLVPDHISLKNGGRKRSIVFGHRKNGEVHLSRYTQNGMDSVLLTAEDFAEELCTLVDKIFREMAPNNPQLKNNILDWWNHYPPIMALP